MGCLRPFRFHRQQHRPHLGGFSIDHDGSVRFGDLTTMLMRLATARPPRPTGTGERIRSAQDLLGSVSTAARPHVACSLKPARLPPRQQPHHACACPTPPSDHGIANADSGGSTRHETDRGSFARHQANNWSLRPARRKRRIFGSSLSRRFASNLANPEVA